jgi:transcriptional regulator with XRE-family HTH domain
MAKQRKSKQYKHLLLLLRQVRQQAGLTQTELARKLSKPQSYVSKFEAGERALDLLELQNLCSAIGLPLTDFVSKFERFKDEAK